MERDVTHSSLGTDEHCIRGYRKVGVRMACIGCWRPCSHLLHANGPQPVASGHGFPGRP